MNGRTALSSSSDTISCTSCCRVRLWEDRRKGYASLQEHGPINPRFHCSQCEGLTPYCTLCRGMAFQAASKARWDFILKIHMDRLGTHAKDVDIHLDYDRFDIYLKALEERRAKSGLGRALSPKAMNQIRDFTEAITSFSQANMFGCIIWGTLKLVLKVASTFTSVFSTISEMLAQLAMQLPLFEEYRSIFPTAYELEEPLRDLYRAWVDFCIDTVLFFKSKRWILLRRLTIGSLKSTFEEHKDTIKKLAEKFFSVLDVRRTKSGAAAADHVMNLYPKDINRQAIVKGLPFPQSNRFIGREDTLEQLHRNLTGGPASDSRPRQYSSAVHGMGGVGKTQLAVEYTFRYKDRYSHIFWLKAETALELATAFGNLARQLTPGQAQDDQLKNIELVLDWFSKNRLWLIVFDNADIELKDYWPTSSHGSILITTQRQSVRHQTTSHIALETFDEYQGARLILANVGSDTKGANEESEKIARQISNELGGLPLLLSHVAGFIDTTKCPLRDVLSLLQQPSTFKRLWAFDSTTSTTFQYGEPMQKVWQLSLSALHPDARRVLDIISMLDADGVSEELLYDDWPGKDLEFLQPAKRFRFHELRRSLIDRHLVTVSSLDGKQVLSIHRTLKQHLIHLLDEKGGDEISIVFNRAVAIIRQAFPAGHVLQAPTNHTWLDCEAALSHALSLHGVYEKWQDRIPANVRLATLLADVSNFLWERGIAGDGTEIIDACEAVCTALEHSEEIYVVHANICAVAGAFYSDLGYVGRERTYQYAIKALQLRKAHIEKSTTATSERNDYLNLSNAWNDVGVMLLEQSEFEKAEPYIQESLRIKRQWTSEDDIPWHYGECYKNRSYIELSRGNLEEAKRLSETATSLCTRDTLEKSAASLKAHFIEGLIALNSHRLYEALDKHKYVLRLRKETFGDNNQHTKHSLFAVGETYRLQEKLDKAEKYFRNALQNPQSWPEPCVARCQLHLVLAILNNKDKLNKERKDEARMLLDEATKTRHKMYGSTTDGTVEDLLRLHSLLLAIFTGRLGIGPSFKDPVSKRINTMDWSD